MPLDLVRSDMGSASAQPRAEAPPRVALALGMAGALGEELLAQLIGDTGYRQVVVGVAQPLGSCCHVRGQEGFRSVELG
jgi:hypothetical protein